MSFLSQFNYRIIGSKELPKLVFLHGLMGFSSNWQRIIKAFESQYQILVYDQRGHGRSFQPEVGYSPDDYAEDLKHILDELEWQQVNLVGHSMGGRNAICFAYNYPEYLKKLVIEDISPEIYEEANSRLRTLVEAVPVPFSSRDASKTFFEDKFPLQSEFLDSQSSDSRTLSSFLQANLLRSEDGSIGWRFSKKAILESLEAGRSQNRWKEWQGIIAPTLLIRGSRSKDLTYDIYLRMLELQKNSRGIIIQDAGHWVHFDQPEAFIEALQKFF